MRSSDYDDLMKRQAAGEDIDIDIIDNAWQRYQWGQEGDPAEIEAEPVQKILIMTIWREVANYPNSTYKLLDLTIKEIRDWWNEAWEQYREDNGL